MGWSPEQVAGRLARETTSMRVSHETIYRFIYDQIRRTNDYSWRFICRGPKPARLETASAPPHGTHKGSCFLAGTPFYIDKRKQFGHWEADLLIPAKRRAVLVDIERASRFTLLAKQPGKQAQPVVDRIKTWFSAMPEPMRRTLTQDNGPESFCTISCTSWG